MYPFNTNSIQDKETPVKKNEIIYVQFDELGLPILTDDMSIDDIEFWIKSIADITPDQDEWCL